MPSVAPPALSSPRQAWGDVLWQLVPNRIALFVFMWAELVWLPPRPALPGVTLLPTPQPPNLLYDGWLRWDVFWYGQIALRGYTNQAQNGAQKDMVFFPLYPLATWAMKHLVGDLYLAGMLVSGISLVGASFLLYRLVELHHGVEVARNALLMMLVYPYSFFLSAMYTESLFLVAVLGAFYLAERERWVLAGLCGAAAALTRVAGVALAPALVLLYLEKKKWRWREIPRDVGACALVGLGPLAHMAYLYERFGDPLVFIANQKVGGWVEDNKAISQILPALKSLFDADQVTHGTLPLFRVFHLLALVLGAYGCVRVMRSGRVAYGVWGLFTILASLQLWTNMARYVVVLFPIYWALALDLRPRAIATWASVSSVFLAIYMVLFSHWYFIS